MTEMVNGWTKRRNGLGEEYWERPHPSEPGVLQRRYETVRARFGAGELVDGEERAIGPLMSIDCDLYDDDVSEAVPSWWVGDPSGYRSRSALRDPFPSR